MRAVAGVSHDAGTACVDPLPTPVASPRSLKDFPVATHGEPYPLPQPALYFPLLLVSELWPRHAVVLSQEKIPRDGGSSESQEDRHLRETPVGGRRPWSAEAATRNPYRGDVPF